MCRGGRPRPPTPDEGVRGYTRAFKIGEGACSTLCAFQRVGETTDTQKLARELSPKLFAPGGSRRLLAEITLAHHAINYVFEHASGSGQLSIAIKGFLE